MDKEELKEAVLKEIWRDKSRGLWGTWSLKNVVNFIRGKDKVLSERAELHKEMVNILKVEGYIIDVGDGNYNITDKLKNRYKIVKKVKK